MAFGFSKSKLSPIAVDFGADSLKLLQLVPSDPPQLVAAACRVLPEEARQGVNERMRFLEEALKSLLREAPFRGRRVICSIPAFQTMIHHAECNVVEGEPLDGQVDLHLRERLEINPSRMVMRYFPTGPIMRDGQSKQGVVCIGAAKDTVMGYVQLAQRCKLEVVGMHCEPPCIATAFDSVCKPQSAEEAPTTTCFVDLGAVATKVMIAEGEQMVFAKNILVGSDERTRNFAEAASIPFSEARETRIPADEDLASQLLQAAATATAEQLDPTHDKLAADRIVEDLRLCLRYFETTGEHRRVDRLVLLGGEARNKRLCLEIAKAIGLPAKIGDPFARLMRIGDARQAAVGVDMNQPQPGWAVPFGLCASEANL